MVPSYRQGLDLSWFGHVDSVIDRPAASGNNLVDHGLSPLLGDLGHNDAGSLARGVQCNGPADTSARAGD